MQALYCSFSPSDSACRHAHLPATASPPPLTALTSRMLRGLIHLHPCITTHRSLSTVPDATSDETACFGLHFILIALL